MRSEVSEARLGQPAPLERCCGSLFTVVRIFPSFFKTQLSVAVTVVVSGGVRSE